MTENPRPLFRPEAIEAHARGRGVDDEGLELKEGQTAWAFRLLLVALLLAVLSAFTFEVSETARGETAEVDGRTAIVTLPAGAAPRLKPGQPVRIDGNVGEVTKVRGLVVEGDNNLVVIDARFPEGEVREGKATVTLNRRTLADLLLRRGRG